MDQKTLDKEVKRFVRRLKSELKPTMVILFGSRARGDDWKRSDYDFIIVSRSFQGVHWLDRISRVVRLWESTSDIDVLPYTPEEFEDKRINSSTVKVALDEGIQIPL